MQSILAELLPLAIQAVGIITGIALAAVSVKVRQWLAEHIRNEAWRSASERIQSVVWDVVRELQQTIVDDAKRLSSDGRLSEEDRVAILGNALDAIGIRLGGKRVVDDMAEVLGWANVTEPLVGMIEAAVFDIKARAFPLGLTTGLVLSYEQDQPAQDSSQS
jgi:hypothetical protein